jgi:hypothetical protein
MPTASPVVDVVIRPGMSEGIDARMLPMGTPRLLKNLRVRQGARFEKRPGTVEVTASSALGFPTSGYGCFVAEHRGLLCAGVETVSTTRGRFVYARNGETGIWTKVGRHGVVVPERRFTISLDDNTAGDFHSCAVVGGTVYVAYTPADSVSATIVLVAIDPSGFVLRKAELASASRPRLIYDGGGTLRLVYRSLAGGATALEVRTVTTSTLALGSAAAVGTLASSGADWDACAVEGGSTWVVAYPTTATNLRVQKFSGTTAGSSNNATTVQQATLIGVAAYEGEHVCAAYLDDNAGTKRIEAFVLDTATVGSGTIGTHTIRPASGNEVYKHQCGVVRVATSTFAVVMGGDDSATSPSLLSSFLSHARITSAGAVTGPWTAYNISPSSKPWTFGDAGERQVLIWANTYNDPSDQQWRRLGAHHIVELEATSATGGGVNLAATTYDEVASYGTNNLQKHLPETVEISTGRRAAVLPWNNLSNFEGLDLAIWRNSTAAASVRHSHRFVTSIADALHISGGCLYDVSESSLVDNATAYYSPENGFPHPPEISVSSSAGGNLTDGESYSYCAVYRWVDSAGRVHRSAPSSVDVINIASPNLTAVVRVATLAASGKHGSVSGAPVAEIYRSWDGGPFYYIGEASGSVANSAVSITKNDDNSDTQVEDNPTLYTDLQLLPVYPPSGARLLCEGGSRLYCVGWRPRVVQFSRLIVDSAPAEFCDDDAFRVFLPEDITAIAYLDGTLVIFSARSIYLVTGDGPNDQGVGAFSEPRRLPVSVGCDDARSVVETPQGIMFKGGGTIWLLPRGFGPPQPVGDDIQETLASYPYVIGACLCANDTDDCVHFVLGATDEPDTDPDATVVAVWDNKLNGWFLDYIDGQIGAAGAALDCASGGFGAASATGQLFTWLLPVWDAQGDVPVRQFNADANPRADRNASGTQTWIESRIGFGDWRPFGAIGWGSIKRLIVHGERVATCSLKLDVSVDHASAVTATKSLGSGTTFYAEHGLSQIKGCSFRFDLYDAELSGKTAGGVWYALAFEAQPLEGTRRLDGNTERF